MLIFVKIHILRLKAEITVKTPKQQNTTVEKKPSKEEEGVNKDSDDEKESDNEDGSQDVTTNANDTLDEIDADAPEVSLRAWVVKITEMLLLAVL